MGDNDKLRRDIKLANAKLEEEVRRGESSAVALESLRATNENLLAICEADKTAIARRDRKMEELKVDLSSEKTRRERAERDTKMIGIERDEAVGIFQKELFSEKELAKKSTSQYEVLATSWRGLDEGYRRQVEKLKLEIKAIQKQAREDQVRFEHLDKLFLQLNEDNEKTRLAKDRVVKEYEAYKNEKDMSLREITERTKASELTNEKALQELLKTMGEMKHVIAVKRDLKLPQKE
jgi:hypothetical protein